MTQEYRFIYTTTQTTTKTESLQPQQDIICNSSLHEIPQVMTVLGPRSLSLCIFTGVVSYQCILSKHKSMYPSYQNP